MTGIEVIDVARESLMAYAKVAGPLLIVTLVVGVIISFLQAVTQIQEQTLTFVPKIIITSRFLPNWPRTLCWFSPELAV